MNSQEFEDLVRSLTALPQETEWVEFKVNNSNPVELGEYISALSNSACLHERKFGYIIFGIEDGTKNIVGTTFNPRTQRVGASELENWLETKLEPGADFRFFEGEVDEKRLIVVQIAASVGYPTNFDKESYIRIGSYKKKLRDHRGKEKALWARLQVESFETNLATSGVPLNAALELLDYSKVFSLLKIPLPTNIDGIAEKLLEEGIIAAHNGRYAVTNLGAILFANNLEEFEHLARKAVRVIEYVGNDKTRTRKEQRGVRGYALGFEGIVAFIDGLVPSTEVIEGATRKTVRSYSKLAIRELVANAIVHQDLLLRGTSPMIEIFDNRIVFTNPGQPLIETLRFMDASPVSRNEKLASMMRRMRYCEERGTGIDKVVSECEENIFPAPFIEAGADYTRVTLYSPKTLRQMDKDDKVRATYQHASLKFLSGSTLTNESLRERFGIVAENYPIASRIINDALEAGLIKPYDPNSSSKRLAKYLPFWA